ncbi:MULTISPECIES: PQQ-binding-like beta-propeller repeat protein [Haloferax]|uniref:PQQ-binding-like beta-propeller repeat protein n=2 Tax=Haloferax TaxID=2251 RepID=A0A6G1Z6K6_9EURY|nr:MULTISPECIES: PQQ-binding-like beta-propeller repeat protein [Haloferax]KAB1185090.1 PQQ-binding-like beta-propeller repeat protein [Haloferax sp. CBA1149]MRW82267.1 PQQ-binding-like beta-propeller repeat protein [Haloferax marinisediminis]
MNRRALLSTIATGGTVALTGCNTTGQSCGPPTNTFSRTRDRWPTPGYGPTNTSYAPAGPSNGEIQWRTDRDDVEGPRLNGWFSTPIVADETVYVATREIDAHDLEYPGYLTALDDETGELQWGVELLSLAGGDPTLAGDTIFVGDQGGTLHAISTDGERRWTQTLGAAVRTPTVIGDYIYVLDASATLYAFTLDGEQCWEYSQSDFWNGILGGGSSFAANSAPAVDESRVYVTVKEDSNDKRTGRVRTAHVQAFDHEGNEEWSFSFPTGYKPPNTPAVVDGTVLVTGGDRIFALDATTGEQQWRFVVGHRHTGAPATDGERVYVGAKNFYALDLGDGSEQWRVVNYGVSDALGWTKSIPFMGRAAVTDDAVYLRAGAFDPSDGSRLWGTLAEETVLESNYSTRHYSRHSMTPLSVTADALYLAHQVLGVTKVA